MTKLYSYSTNILEAHSIHYKFETLLICIVCLAHIVLVKQYFLKFICRTISIQTDLKTITLKLMDLTSTNEESSQP